MIGAELVPNISEASAWAENLKQAEHFIPQARDAWSRLTNKPWNKTAMVRVLAEFARHLETTAALAPGGEGRKG